MVHTVILKYSKLFSCKPWRRHLGEYRTGLMIAERKTWLISTRSLPGPLINAAGIEFRLIRIVMLPS